MGRYPYGDTLVMCAISCFSPEHGGMTYWTGAEWERDGSLAALYPKRETADHLIRHTLRLPDGAQEATVAYRQIL